MIWLYVIMNVEWAWLMVNECEHWTCISDYERLWMTVNIYEHDMNDYEHWTNMNDCEIIEWSLWVVCECEQGVICEWEQGVIYEWKRKSIYEWKQRMICEWVWGTIKSKEQSTSEEWYVNEWYVNNKHLRIICAFHEWQCFLYGQSQPILNLNPSSLSRFKFILS
jgi:hypothetical protein